MFRGKMFVGKLFVGRLYGLGALISVAFGALRRKITQFAQRHPSPNTIRQIDEIAIRGPDVAANRQAEASTERPVIGVHEPRTRQVASGGRIENIQLGTRKNGH